MTVYLLSFVLLLLVVTLPPLAHVAYTRWVRRRFPLAGESFVHEGARLHFTRCGAGPVVVLVHGANGTWNDFPPELITELARDHTVLAVDRPGHGWSEAHAGPLGMHENAAAVLALLRMQQTWATTVAIPPPTRRNALSCVLYVPENPLKPPPWSLNRTSVAELTTAFVPPYPAHILSASAAHT